MDSTPWYQEVWFVIVVILAILIVFFVVSVVVCLRCVGPHEAYIRNRMPLPPPHQKVPRDILAVGDAFASGLNAGPGVGVVNPVFSTPTPTPVPRRRAPPSPTLLLPEDPEDYHLSERRLAEETETETLGEMESGRETEWETGGETEAEMEVLNRETGDGASGDEEGRALAEKGKQFRPVPAKRKKRTTLAEMAESNTPSTSGFVTTQQTILPATAV